MATSLLSPDSRAVSHLSDSDSGNFLCCPLRWALLYGTILTNARAMGEFGAVSVISGNILGKTQTLTLFVESAYKVCANA